VTVAQPEIKPDNAVGAIKLNQKVTITCATEGASIYYTLDGTAPDATKTLYTEPFSLPEGTEVDDEITIRAIAIKDGVSSLERRVALMVQEAGEGPDDPVTPPTPGEKPNAPKFEVDGEAVTAATLAVSTEKVAVKWIGEANDDYMVIYTLDGSEEVFKATSMFDMDEDANFWNFGDEAFDVTVPVTIKARVAATTNAGDITWSDMTTLSLTLAEATPVELTFDPASGSEVEAGTVVTITANQEVELFYMMFESEEAAKAAEWDQEKAASYSAELKPVLSKEQNTLKVAYALSADAESVEETFFYATYKIKEQPAIELTFNPASGSEVEDNTTVTVTASREVEIFYGLYADKAAADADEAFMANAKEVKEDGMPVITKAAPYLRCGVSDNGEMKYFDAAYTVKTVANENEELAGVSVYPNPSNGVFNIELPVAATIEVFMSNGMLYQRLKLSEGATTLNIERSGIYFLRITGEGRTTVKRLIIR
ncbi:MAG: chitobiase/beta-hexosaminidase C-terminal domain-containing protein, partial [Bacteroidales bacterium]|nr:chitobiase/beta-hexosaminidase C-terminal domain-containing protein [Bacteroidales bacterium]